MRYSLLPAAVLALAGMAAGAAPPKSGTERDVQDFVYMGDKGPVLLRFHVIMDGKPFIEVWEAFMGRLFAYLDQDGDGVLSKDEASRVPPVQALFNNLPNIPDPLDKNHDGKVTREELAEWYRRVGATPFRFRTGSAPQEQVVVRFVGQPQPMSADALNEKLFALLDTNKDGKLSRAELSQAPAILSRLDLDDDEVVSVAEMNGDVDRSNENGFVVAAALIDAQQTKKGSPFVMVSPGPGSKDLARELLAHYAPKGKRSAVRKLTRKDLGLDEATFAKLDADEDGALDAEELAQFARRPPDLKIRVRIGKKADSEAAIELVLPQGETSPMAKAVRQGRDGTLLLELGNSQIQFGPADTSGDLQYAVVVRQQYLAQFRAADRDNNGYLDKTEAEQNLQFRSLFRIMDRDGDGKLFEKEVMAYLDKMKELQEDAVQSCASLAVKDQGRGLFDMVDADSDGRLSLRELRQVVKLVDQLDRDGDGAISSGEIPHKYRAEVRRGPAASNQFAPGAVTISKMGVTQPSLPERANGPRWFRKMDRNHDGDVSRREFLGTDEEFRKIDDDGDGLISVDEADKADKRFRKEKDSTSQTAKPTGR
jgi:Ca2+-binding EF-hand superfamily protein